MNDKIKEIFDFSIIASELINFFNNKNECWQDELLIEFILHKVRNYDYPRLNPLNHLSSLQLILLMQEYEDNRNELKSNLKGGN